MKPMLTKEIQDEYSRENFRRIETIHQDFSSNITGLIAKVLGGITGKANLPVKTYTAGEELLAFTPVYLSTSSKVLKGNSSVLASAQIIGITLNQASKNGNVDVVFFGLIEDNSFGYSIKQKLYCNDKGQIVTTPGPTYTCELGFGMGTGAIFLNIKDPI